MRLFLVELRGMRSTYGTSYVVADNTDEAYRIVKKFIDEHDLGFGYERELSRVTLLADEYQYSHCEHMLHIKKED